MLLYVSILLLLSSCISIGTSHVVPKIVGGNETTIEEHPWQIFFQTPKVPTCGGSIISPDTIITAAHCINMSLLKKYEVIAGTSNRLKGGVRVKLSSIVVHENFFSYGDYDVAILKLAQKLNFTKKIQPLTVGEHELPAGTAVIVSGWGFESEYNITSPDVLRAVEVKIINRDTCIADYAEAHSRPFTSRMICAGVKNGGKDACRGDSGGPLTKDGVLYGIVSTGLGCGEAPYPGIYTNVPELRNWIKKHSEVLEIAVTCYCTFPFFSCYRRASVPKIIGGNETTIEEHPWQIFFQTPEIPTCGGSIISPDTIVTAAHCIDMSLLKKYEVIADTSNRLKGGIRVKLNSIAVHENFIHNGDYDVAILKLAQKLNFTKKIQPVTVGEHELPAGTAVIVSGWGFESEYNSTGPDVLRAVEVKIINRHTCIADYAEVHSRPFTSRMICAGVKNGGKDACRGDSGGPLTKDGVLYGIVSAGIGCGEAQYPGIYTNVPELQGWIKKHSGL